MSSPARHLTVAGEPAGRVLVVDDDPDLRASLRDLLELSDLSVETASSSSEALSVAAEFQPAVVLIDVGLGPTNGLGLIPLLKAKRSTIQCLVLTAHRDTANLRRALQLKADDYLFKPLEPEALVERVVHHVGRYRRQVEANVAREKLERMALRDSLTGLPNRALFDELLEKALSHAIRHDRWLAVFFIDVDGFKEINDSFGHAAGDALLTRVARRLGEAFRREDAVARVGGDEFCAFATEIDEPDGSARVARRIVRKLRHPFPVDGQLVRVTGSVGVALHPTDGGTAERLLARADEAMYRVKAAGKDGFRMFGEESYPLAAGLARRRRA